MDTKRKMEELVKLQPELDNVDLKTIQLLKVQIRVLMLKIFY